MKKETSIKLFESKKIRVHWEDAEERWYFSIIDIIETLTDSNNPRRYWSDLKRKLSKEGFNQLYEIIVQLKLESSDGKKYVTDCADTEGLLRIIQSIPSPKAEPFKRWLAKVGYERIEETEDSEKAYGFVVNGKKAIEWIMERYQLTIHKESGIKNNPNDWATEVSNPRYILDLLLSIINVSVQTVEIVKGLPRLVFE